MATHTHACLPCTPELVPDHSRTDPKYHEFDTWGKPGEPRVTVDDKPVEGRVVGAYEGAEGWALRAGRRPEDVHVCPDAGGAAPTICVEPVFGRVKVTEGT